MTNMTMFFTDRSIENIVEFEGNSAGINRYRYRDSVIYDTRPDEYVISGMVNYDVRYIDPDLPVIALAKEYLKKVGKEFIVIETWMGYPTPPHELMPEVVIDLRDTMPELWPNSPLSDRIPVFDIEGTSYKQWPRTLAETLPDEATVKDYRLVESAEEFLAETPTKKYPGF